MIEGGFGDAGGFADLLYAHGVVPLAEKVPRRRLDVFLVVHELVYRTVYKLSSDQKYMNE
jgi:hypothetical protein